MENVIDLYCRYTYGLLLDVFSCSILVCSACCCCCWLYAGEDQQATYDYCRSLNTVSFVGKVFSFVFLLLSGAIMLMNFIRLDEAVKNHLKLKLKKKNQFQIVFLLTNFWLPTLTNNNLINSSVSGCLLADVTSLSVLMFYYYRLIANFSTSLYPSIDKELNQALRGVDGGFNRFAQPVYFVLQK